MAGEWDRKLIPELFQDMLTLSLGATYKGIEMVKTPQQSADQMVTEVKTLFSLPDDAGEGLQNKAKAVAAVWMERAVTWMETFRKEGTQFTEDPDSADQRDGV